MSRIVYHGTSTRVLFDIFTKGFRLKDPVHGRMQGDGIYVAQEVLNAANWLDVHPWGAIVKCRIKKGLKVFWLDREWDSDVIKFLQKEFGREIIKSPDINKVLPRNKQLKTSELIHLANYLFEKRMLLLQKCGKKENHPLVSSIAPIIKQIKYHRYEAIGDRSRKYWDSDEIVIFNPSHVEPIEAFRARALWDKETAEIKEVQMEPLDQNSLNSISAEAEAEWRAWLES